MSNENDRKEQIGKLADRSRNQRQASVFLGEIARHCGEVAARKCAQSDKLIKECKETYEQSKKLRDRRAG